MWSYLYVFEQLRLFHLVYPSMVKKAPIVPASNSNILQSSVLCLEGGGLYLQHGDASVASLSLISNITHRFPHRLSFSNH